MDDPYLRRRLRLLAPMLSVLFPQSARASPIDARKTLLQPAERIAFRPRAGLPPDGGEMAKLYGDFDAPCPYRVVMKCHPGFFNPPHRYATDRIPVVICGTRWVNSGDDFTAGCGAVTAGGFVRRTARTPHYGGVLRAGHAPAVVAVFGMGSVDIRLIGPARQSRREV